MLHFLFPTLVYNEPVPRSETVRQQFIDKAMGLYKTLPKTSTWRCETFTTIEHYDMINDPMFAEFFLDVKKHVGIFLKEYNVTKGDINITDSWFNVSQPGDYQEYHNHPGNHLSAVYYVKTNDTCGNLVVRSFEADTDMFLLPIESENYNTYKTFSLRPIEGHLVIFRSNLKHMVEKNISAESRISIAMNFIVKETL